jgi:hypothetical protein
MAHFNHTYAFMFDQVEQCCKVAPQARNQIKVIIEQIMVVDTRNLHIKAMQKLFTKLRTKFIALESVDWHNTKAAFKVAIILCIINRFPHLAILDINWFVEIYPEFESQNQTELQLLMNFRNFMHASLHMTSAEHHKLEHLYNVAFLCGASLMLGGGQKPFTTRRCLIYDRERAHVGALLAAGENLGIPSYSPLLLQSFPPAAAYANSSIYCSPNPYSLSSMAARRLAANRDNS